MSKMLAKLYLFCEENKECSKILRITRYSDIKEVTEHSCDTIELEMTQYESLNIDVNHGENVLSFMLQGCMTDYEEKIAKVHHHNQLYLELEFID